MCISRAARSFDGWEEGMIWSCLQGYMGKLTADNSDAPESAMADVGDICFWLSYRQKREQKLKELEKRGLI